MAFTAFFDACVLYPAPLRDLLIRLAMTPIFRARWSDRVHEEWIRKLLKSRPELEQQLTRTRALMDAAVPDCLVTGYETLAGTLSLPDPNDTHVLAAALVGRADVIVTSNLRHFPKSILDPLNIEAQHPDDFIRHTLDFDEATAIGAVRGHRLALKNPAKTAEEYLDTLAAQALVKTAMFLRPWRRLI